MFLSKVTLYVNNQEQAKSFWLDKMGFKVVLENEMGPGFTWLEVGSEDSNTSLVLYNKEMMKKQNPSVSVECPSLLFSTTDIDSEYKRLEEVGVKVDELMKMPYGSMFTFYDQDGNGFILREDK